MRVLFISSGGPNKIISPIIKNQGTSLIKEGIQIEYFLIKGSGLISYIKAIYCLRKKLSKHSFDIIHAHYGLCGIVSLLSRKKMKVIISFMGDDIIGSRKDNGSIYLMSRAFVFLNIILAKYFYTYVIVKSQEMRNAIGNIKNLSIIPNGVDLNFFIPKSKEVAMKNTKFDPTKKNIVFVSDPSRAEKNFSLAKKTIDNLMIDNFKLHVIFNVNQEQLCNFFNAADCLFMTSFHEGSPNVIKEAMACNCPIVCTDVGDVRHLFSKIPGHYIVNFNTTDIGENLIQATKFRENYKFTKGRDQIINLGLDSISIGKKIVGIYENLMH